MKGSVNAWLLFLPKEHIPGSICIEIWICQHPCYQVGNGLGRRHQGLPWILTAMMGHWQNESEIESRSVTLVWASEKLTRLMTWNILQNSLVSCCSFPQPLPPYTFFFLFSFFFFFFIWRLIILQYCSGFCHILTWISHGFTCVPDPEPPSYLPPHPIPQCTGFEYPVSHIKLGLVLYFTYANIHVSMLFSQIIPLSPSPRVQKSIFISVSLLLSHI